MIGHDLAPSDQQDSLATRCLVRLMRPLSSGLKWPYRLFMALRNRGYTSGLFASSQPQGSYVVSIGNLSVGGSGKTPLTELLAKQLLALDHASKRKMQSETQETPPWLAILSRGYRSRCEKAGSHLLFHTAYRHARSSFLPSPAECGDEPYMLAQRIPGVWFGIGRNRLDLAMRLAEKGVRLFLLDDGFQHRRLKRQCDLVLLDAENPFANHQLFPRGPLREPPCSLARAGTVILYPVRDMQQFSRSRQQVASHTKAPCVGMAPVVTGAYFIFGAQTQAHSECPELLPLSCLKDASVAVLCGIARPERFIATLKSLECRIIMQSILADHDAPSLEVLTQFAASAAARGAQYLVCTEKDAVKWTTQSGCELFQLALPILFLRIELRVVAGEAEWDALVQHIYHAVVS